MRQGLQWAFWGVGLFLQVLVISALLRGAYRRYPLFFAYAVGLFLTTSIEVAAVLSGTLGNWYWFGDLIRQSLLFAAVVSLFEYASGDPDRRRALLRVLVPLAVLYFAGSAYLSYDAKLAVWMTTVVRNTSFGSAILTFLLWSLLISNRLRPIVPLMISGGLGIQFAGEALGQSMRQLWRWSKVVAFAGNVAIVLAGFVGLIVWYYAFRRAEEPEPAVTRRQTVS